MRSALGKGLSALISEETVATISQNPSLQNSTVTLPISSITPNPKQPRHTFSDESLSELAESIRQRGVLQPILVSPTDHGMYEIIAGERRWRAVQKAGLKEIPVIIKGGSELDHFEMALIENVQREDLNPIDQAEGFARLMNEYHLTQEEISSVIGKDRAVVANTVRLLNLPEPIRKALIEEKISASHARALVALDDPAEQNALFQRILTEQLSVRAVEKAVQEHKQIKVRGHVRGAGKPKAIEVKALEEDLQRTLARKVELQISSPTAQKGWVRLEFYSLDDLDQLVLQLKKSTGKA